MLQLESLFMLNLGQPLGQLRSLPLQVGGRRAILFAYSADYGIDPYSEMFFFPTDTLKLALVDLAGQVLWRRDLGKGVIPGTWFAPFYALDLDGDGDDEIFFVNNVDAAHPLSVKGRRLERIDARTGESTGQWPWPCADRRMGKAASHAYREFILGGHVRGKPVLVTAQGTYADMTLQGWHADPADPKQLSPRWELSIGAADPGARGSHVCPVVDINHDDVDEIMWGERCISIDTGKQLFCCDGDTWHGHSDLVQPVLDRATGKWSLYTFREQPATPPRVAVYDDVGNRKWSDLEKGHMDMGWVANLDDRGPVAMTIRIGQKTSGPGGHGHQSREQFAYRVLTGERYDLLDAYRTIPVDLNGDGRHELVRGLYWGDGVVFNAKGEVIGQTGGYTSMVGHIADHHGEQLVVFTPDGEVRLIADRAAEDSPAALERYRHRFYRATQRLTATGHNIHLLGGV